MRKLFNVDVISKVVLWQSIFMLGFISGTLLHSAPKQLMGDVNQDGKASISDIEIVKSHILGNSELTYEQMDLADVNNDAVIDVIDILEIRRIILSKESN